MLPTNGPYMLRDVFSTLLCGEEPPAASDIWESSRFFAVGRLPELSPLHTAFQLVEGMFACALARGCRRIVSVSDVRVERLIRRIGVPIQRFGHPQLIGGVLAMAGWADVSAENLRLAREAAWTAGEVRKAS